LEILMGRRKTYDRVEVTDRAMQLFWERGYHDTSTRDLTEAMGINAYSLYAEFGSKQQLYDDAMDHYQQTVVTQHFGRLEAEAASLEDVVAVLRYFGGGEDVLSSTRGCLACNAAVELAPTPEASRASTDRYVARVAAAFGNALRNARTSGELRPDTPVDELAQSLTVSVMGMLVLIRSGSRPEFLNAAAGQLLTSLERHRAHPGS
jgi:TetR/AcrR family transcriptional regulator, transcriptional repressor for nem operon